MQTRPVLNVFQIYFKSLISYQSDRRFVYTTVQLLTDGHYIFKTRQWQSEWILSPLVNCEHVYYNIINPQLVTERRYITLLSCGQTDKHYIFIVLLWKPPPPDTVFSSLFNRRQMGSIFLSLSVCRETNRYHIFILRQLKWDFTFSLLQSQTHKYQGFPALQ